VVAHAYNPQHSGGRGRQISEFEASLVYRMSSRTARAIQRNPVSKKKKKDKNCKFTILHMPYLITRNKGVSVTKFEIVK
jgi:hypothetical protein